MAQCGEDALAELQRAQMNAVGAVLFVHGHSTSRRGRTSKRSVVRGLMRSKKATPFIIRRACKQHESAFLVSIRPRKQIGGRRG
jgi:hypothetical protein